MRAWKELLYVLVTVPLSVVGFAYVVVGFAVGAVLSVTALGVPVLAVMVPATRVLGRLRLGLARALLGERVAGPAPFEAGHGVFERLRSGLRDGAGWRAVAFQVTAVPLAMLEATVTLCTWAWGLVAFTAPVQRAFGMNVTGAGWPRLLALSAAGAALLVLAPWAVRLVLLLDRLLVRALLGRDERSARIAALQRSRATAVADAAATLRRIERDLHDGVQARLVALTMNLTAIGELLPRDPEASREMLGTARTNARDAIRDLRDVIQHIHPPVLDNGLDAALATLAARSQVPVTCEVRVPVRPLAAIETIAYFCVAELLTNVAKHSAATEARVEVTQGEDGLRVVVTDNGRGGADPRGGSGLRGLVDRVGTVDGDLYVDSPPGGPTVIRIELPTCG